MLGGCGRMLGGRGRALGGPGGCGRVRTGGGGGPPDGVVSGAVSLGRCRTGGGGGPLVRGGGLSWGAATKRGGAASPSRGGGLSPGAAPKNGCGEGLLSGVETTNGCAGVSRSFTAGSTGGADGVGRGAENAGRGGAWEGRGAVGTEWGSGAAGPLGAGLSFSPISSVRPYYLPNPWRPSKCAPKTVRCTRTCATSPACSGAWSSDCRVPKHFAP